MKSIEELKAVVEAEKAAWLAHWTAWALAMQELKKAQQEKQP